MLDKSIVVEQLEKQDHHYTSLPLLPERTLLVSVDECAQYQDVTVTGWVPSMEYPFLYAEETFLINVPTIVYQMRWRRESKTVRNFRLAVTPDETVKTDSLLYRWPFSNVLSGQSVCWTAQQFSCELQELVHKGVYGFLQTPNNLDGFGIGVSQNSKHANYDDFLHSVQEKGCVDAEWLIPIQKTVAQFHNN